MIPKKLLITFSALILIGFYFLFFQQNAGPAMPIEVPPSELGFSVEDQADYAAQFSEIVDLPVFQSVSTENVVYHTTEDGTEVSGYLALPEGEGPFPGIVMIHEWWGLNEQIESMARDYAGQGYAVLAVDLYEGESTEDPARARELSSGVRGLPETALANLRGAMDYLDALSNVDGERLASLGWCFGGGWSYQMAKNNLGTQASVIYYGQFNPEDDLEIMSANIQGHFGENDELIPVDDVLAFRAKLDTLNGEHQVFIYENAGHAFQNEDSDSYNEASAQQAWERTLTFLAENL